MKLRGPIVKYQIFNFKLFGLLKEVKDSQCTFTKFCYFEALIFPQQCLSYR